MALATAAAPSATQPRSRPAGRAGRRVAYALSASTRH